MPYFGGTRQVLLRRRNPPVSTFVPTDIAGLLVWLKADSLSLSDGDPVGTWADQSGNARDGTQGTAGSKPTYKTGISGFNSMPTVSFDGTDDYLTLPAATHPVSGSTATLAMVWKNNGGSAWSFFGCQNGGASGYNYDNNSTFAGRLAMDKVGVENGPSAAYTVDTNAHVLIYTINGASSTIRVDNTDLSLSTTGTGAAITDPAGNPALGARNAQSSFGVITFMTGYIAEFLTWPTALSAGDRTSLLTYLGAKYAITVV